MSGLTDAPRKPACNHSLLVLYRLKHALIPTTDNSFSWFSMNDILDKQYAETKFRYKATWKQMILIMNIF